MNAPSADFFDSALDGILSGCDDCGAVVIGPVVWRASDGRQARLWYFHAALPSKGDFHLVQIDCGGSDREDATLLRSSFAAALARRRPMVIHITEDELQMARICEALWPGERIAGIRAQIESERTAA